jgi:HSP20 family protein
MANIRRYDPFAEFGRMSVFDEPFDNLLRRWLRPVRVTGEAAPMDIAIDVTENDKDYTVRAEVPGVNKDDISVNIDGNQVSINAEVKREKEDKEGEKVLRSERYYGSMLRSFTLPGEVDQAKAEAKYANGVLELTLPKKAGAGVKKLEIH